MSTGTEDFEKLQKLLKFKRLEQPPPGYFNRFSSVVINRIEREGESSNDISAVPWLKKLFGLFESSPVAAGLFGAALCAVVIFGIAAANKADKAPSAFAPVANNAAMEGSSNSSLAFNQGTHSPGARSTDAIFDPSVLGSAGSMTAQVEPVSFSTSSK